MICCSGCLTTWTRGFEHLAAVDYGWFCETFGRDTEPLPLDDADPEADLRVEPHETTADIAAFYGRARTRPTGSSTRRPSTSLARRGPATP